MSFGFSDKSIFLVHPRISTNVSILCLPLVIPLVVRFFQGCVKCSSVVVRSDVQQLKWQGRGGGSSTYPGSNAVPSTSMEAMNGARAMTEKRADDARRRYTAAHVRAAKYFVFPATVYASTQRTRLLTGRVTSIRTKLPDL